MWCSGPSNVTYCRITMASVRGQVVQLYKNLLHLGRDYPKGYDYFRSRLKAAFLKNRDVKDPEQLTMLLARGQYIIKELEALYMLKKYRTLKKRYYTDTP
ncbi:electron transfer flavoprotein regulatory factor 1 isoform X1 [Rhipicephalus sanguineus]|uniref:electron transfer flavoprotein regulatory factor 1 isoform X1 n=1 Tax=Rhipicephalus sanguineus TaxID=34632 RepID=UPI001892DF32|nr:electron transfer flavoprotein regulatory factor 1 isoform X1 [Rhipicephalus sanguineus]XP_037503491.1 electron transfer flavoprotein regulatory factor 1 isoform X1 [Rhipicephalus sanguineus]